MAAMRTGQANPHDEIDSNPSGWWVAAQLMALGIHLPLVLFSGHNRAIANSTTVIATGLAVGTLAIVVHYVLRRFVPGWKALAWASVLTLSFWHSNSMAPLGPIPGWLVSLGLLWVLLAAAGRYARHRYFRFGMLYGSLVLAGTMVLLGVHVHLETTDATVRVSHEVEHVKLTATPDIYLVILDGYGRADVVDEMFDHDIEPFVNQLTELGFVVPPRSTSNYTVTHLAVPAIMQMAYVHEPDNPLSNSDLEALAAQFGGSNAVVDILKDNGYTYVHGESINESNQCGPAVDVCLGGPLIDTTIFALLSRTPIGAFFYPRVGSPITALNVSRIEQMASWRRISSEIPTPKFTLLHLVLPHPPLFLDANCQPRVEDELGGRIMNDGRISDERLDRRIDAWTEQVDCANKTILEFLAQVPREAVLIVTSDHGPDVLFRLFRNDGPYTQTQLAERLPTMTALRLPDRCQESIPDDLSLVNLFRYTFSCLGDREIAPLTNRHFVGSFAGRVIEFKFDDVPAD